MIISNFNSKEYAEIKKAHPLFEKGLEAAKRFLENPPATDGRHEVDGDDVYIMVSSYTTNPVNSDRVFESHKDYIDVQLLLEGKEMIGFADKEELTVTVPYTPDYELYAMVDEFDKVILTKGKFAIIYPDEPHAPGLAAGEPCAVRKIVIKIKA